ncbi:hypothetical protein [Nostoc sp.]
MYRPTAFQEDNNVSSTLLQSSDPAARAVGAQMKQNLDPNEY